VLVVVGWL